MVNVKRVCQQSPACQVLCRLLHYSMRVESALRLLTSTRLLHCFCPPFGGGPPCRRQGRWCHTSLHAKHKLRNQRTLLRWSFISPKAPGLSSSPVPGISQIFQRSGRSEARSAPWRNLASPRLHSRRCHRRDKHMRASCHICR
jgi:hypothetical protein